MDDKMLDLMTRMYSDMQEMKADIKGTRDELKETKTSLRAELKETKISIRAELMETKTSLHEELKETRNELKSDIRKLYNKIENDIEPKLGALFDGYKQTYELHIENSKKLDNIAEKVIQQEVEIKVIQGGKK